MRARQAAQRIRNKLSPAWIATASAMIEDAVLALPEFQQARTIGLYLARPKEVATDRLRDAAWSSGRRLCLPAYQKALQAYGMCRWEPGSALHPGHYGIAEPADPVWVPVTDIDLMIVTALAFDASGWRLGHGGGYFDRLLAGHRGPKICLAFACQELTAVPSEPHDVPVNIVVTERGVLRAPARLAYADPEAWKHR